MCIFLQNETLHPGKVLPGTEGGKASESGETENGTFRERS